MILVTEEKTEVTVQEGANEWVEVSLYGGGFGDEDDVSGQPLFLSLTPKEARRIADALLTASQRTEDRAPHGNC